MAGLRQFSGKYYARIRTWNGVRQDESLLPLKTKNEAEAIERLLLVNKYEKNIKKGIELEFPWMNNESELIVKNYSLDNAIKDFIENRSKQNIRPKTIEQNSLALRHLVKVLGKTLPIDNLELRHIDIFKNYWSKYHSVTTINMNLRAIKTFLFWLKDRDKISTVPKIKQLQTNNSLPIYLTESEFDKIMEYDGVEDYYKSVFMLYRDTGCRLSEPFKGLLDGNWLSIDANNSKTHSARDIQLDNQKINLVNKMQSNVVSENSIKHFSKVFKKVCKVLKINKHFHCLRHTFAVRRYLQTGDIYLVKKELGHASVTTTEIYTKFNIRKLIDDFPSLIVSSRFKEKMSY